MAYTGIPAPFSDITNFDKMHFWAWASAQEKRNDVTINNYLDSLDFVVGQDKLTDGEYTTLNFAVETWHRTTPWIREVLKFNELFTPADEGGYYVFGAAKRYYPTQKVIDAIHEAGWIYNVNPMTTYFEIIQGNRLYAKYQQVIGSRFIAIIK